MLNFVRQNLGILTILAVGLYFLQAPYKSTVEGKTRSISVVLAGFLWIMTFMVFDFVIYPYVIYYALENGMGWPIFGWATTIVVLVTWLKSFGLIKKKMTPLSKAFYFIPNLYLIYIFIIQEKI